MKKSWELNRRTFLQGMGVSLALPVLDAMMPSMARAATASIPRFAAIYIPTGIYGGGYDPTKNAVRTDYPGEYGKHRYFLAEPLPDAVIKGIWPTGTNTPSRARTAWFPSTTGALTAAFPPITSVLEPLKQKLTFVSGLSLSNKDVQHGAPQVYLNDDVGYVQGKFNPRSSVDQEIANFYGLTPGSTIVFHPGTQGDDNYKYISYNSKLGKDRTICPISSDPREKFNRLFGSCNSTTVAKLTAEQQKNKSILDFVADSIGSVQKKLGSDDKIRLDAYLTNIRDLETKLTTLTSAPSTCPTLPSQDPASSSGPLAQVTLENMMIDVMALAMASDIMPIATLMLDGDGFASNNYGPRVDWGSEFIGFNGKKMGFPSATSEWHFDISHHQQSFAQIEPLIALNQYEVRFFKRLAEKLNNMPVEPNGYTPLDNSIIMTGSGMSDGYHHTNCNMPLVLAGGKKWGMAQGQHLSYTLDTPMGNLYYSILLAMGVAGANFNGHSSKLNGLFG